MAIHGLGNIGTDGNKRCFAFLPSVTKKWSQEEQ